MMTGLIGRKVGMMQFYSAEGNLIPVTVVETGPCVVVQKKTHGYRRLQRPSSRFRQQEGAARE